MGEKGGERKRQEEDGGDGKRRSDEAVARLERRWIIEVTIQFEVLFFVCVVSFGGVIGSERE